MGLVNRRKQPVDPFAGHRYVSLSGAPVNKALVYLRRNGWPNKKMLEAYQTSIAGVVTEDVSDGLLAQVPDATYVVQTFQDLIFRRGGHLCLTGEVTNGRRQISWIGRQICGRHFLMVLLIWTVDLKACKWHSASDRSSKRSDFSSEFWFHSDSLECRI